MILDDLFGEILTPSGQPGPMHKAYERAVEGIGHAMLGAGLVSLLGVWGLLPGMAVAAVYWWVKERGDLRRGGDWLDGIEDALMVSLGAWYGLWWWPAVMLGCGAYLMVMGARK